jgi:hypothetical protein
VREVRRNVIGVEIDYEVIISSGRNLKGKLWFTRFLLSQSTKFARSPDVQSSQTSDITKQTSDNRQ